MVCPDDPARHYGIPLTGANETGMPAINPWVPPADWTSFHATDREDPPPPAAKKSKSNKTEKRKPAGRISVSDDDTEGEEPLFEDSSDDEDAHQPKTVIKPKLKAATKPVPKNVPKPSKKRLQPLVGPAGSIILTPLVGMKVKARWEAPPKPAPAIGALEAGKYAGGKITGVDLEHQHADITFNDGLTESAVLFINIRLWA